MRIDVNTAASYTTQVTQATPETDWLRSKDGTRLLTRGIARQDAKATLLIVHGYGEHSGRYLHVLDHFGALGYDVHAFDYRGHGESDGHRGHVVRFRDYLDDLDAVVQHHRERIPPDRPLFLIAHSLGGLIAAAYLLEQPAGITAAVLSSPALGFAVRVGAAKVMLAKVMSAVYPTLSLPTGIPAEDLSTDASVGVAYMADPKVNKVATARWYTEALAQQDAVLRHADRIQLPILVMVAGADRVVDPDVSESFVAALGSADKQYKRYPGLFHELFNEVRKEEVFADLEAFLAAHL